MSGSKSNIQLFIIILIAVSLLIFINKNELFVNINNTTKLALFNCKNKLKSCKKTGENVEWDSLDSLENESTIKYYLNECNNEFKNSKC